MEQSIQQERAKNLEQQAREYLMRSNDPIFTQYLQQLLPRIQKQPEYVEQLQAELDKSVEFWHQRQQINAERTGHAQTQAQSQTTWEQQQSQTTWEQQQLQQPAGAGQGPVQLQQPVPAAPKKQSMEYMFATVALSVVGGIFILTALVLMGMYFMNGWIKGISLYVVSLAVVAFAELFIRRKLPGLAQIFSAIGVAALYLTTMINTLSLHNFGIVPAAVIIALITAGTILISRKRDSLIHRLLGIAACWLCAYPLTMTPAFTEAEILLVLALIFMMNILCLCIPVNRFHTASHVIQMVSTTIMFPAVIYWILNIQEMQTWIGIVAYGVFFLTGNLILMRQAGYAEKEKQAGRAISGDGMLAMYITYIIVSGLTVGSGLSTWWTYGQNEFNAAIYVVVAIALVVTVIAVPAMRTAKEKWLPCYFFSFVALCAVSVDECEWAFLICATVLLLFGKILERLAKGGLRLLDAILTTLYCVMLLLNGDDIPYAYMLLAGTIISMFLVYGWTTYQEIILTFSLAAYAAWNLMPMLKLPAFSGILFVSILLFNNVKYMRGKNIFLFNIFVLVGQIGALIGLANPVYRNSYITYLCMLVFVLAYLVLTLQERYYKEFKHRNIIIVIFLTYMALIVKTNIPVVNSILIMLIALISVTLGFVKKDKPVRIYGLVLSLVTCGKIALYDYWGAPVLQKMILFFAVGAIALVIAGIYIILEKKCND